MEYEVTLDELKRKKAEREEVGGTYSGNLELRMGYRFIITNKSTNLGCFRNSRVLDLTAVEYLELVAQKAISFILCYQNYVNKIFQGAKFKNI